MVTKVEEVARAILAKVPAGYGMTVAEAAVYARSAIEAMRVPTHGMLSATEEVVVGYDDFACGDGTLYMHHGDAESAWQAMIDAALNEKDPA